MTFRREVLAGLAAGAAGAVAGCGTCSQVWNAFRFYFDVEDVGRAASGWELAVSVTVHFDYPSGPDVGVGPFDIALYGADRSLLDYATVDGVRWGDLSAAERTDAECGEKGSTSVTESFSVPEVPHYVGPRVVDESDVDSFVPEGNTGVGELEALRYVPARSGRGTPTGTADAGAPNETAGGGMADETAGDGRSRSTAGDGRPHGTVGDGRVNQTLGAGTVTPAGNRATAADPASPAVPTDTGGPATGTPAESAATVSPADFEPVTVESLPWPEPDNQAVRETDRFAAVRFRTGAGCAVRGSAWSAVSFRGELHLGWERPIPEGSCERPFLEGVSFEDRRLTVRVGLHEAPQVRCHGCDFVAYELTVEPREGAEPLFDLVELVHLAPDGTVVERVLEPVE